MYRATDTRRSASMNSNRRMMSSGLTSFSSSMRCLSDVVRASASRAADATSADCSSLTNRKIARTASSFAKCFELGSIRQNSCVRLIHSIIDIPAKSCASPLWPHAWAYSRHSGRYLSETLARRRSGRSGDGAIGRAHDVLSADVGLVLWNDDGVARVADDARVAGLGAAVAPS